MFGWLSSWKRRTNERLAALEIGGAITNEKLKAIEQLIDENKSLLYQTFDHQTDRFAKRFGEIEQRLQAMDDTMAHDNAVGALSQRLDAFSTALADLTTAVLADRAAAQSAFDGFSSAFHRHSQAFTDLRTELQQLITQVENRGKDLKVFSTRLDQLEAAHRQSRNHPPHPSDSFTAQDPALLPLIQQLQQQQALLQSLTQGVIRGGPVGAVQGGYPGRPERSGRAAAPTSPQSGVVPQYETPYGGADDAVHGDYPGGPDWTGDAAPAASPQAESAPQYKAPSGGPNQAGGAAPATTSWAESISQYQTASGGGAGGTGMYEIIDPRTERVIGYGREG